MFCDDSGKTLAEVSQRNGECPIPGNIHRQVGQGSEQADLSEDATAHCKSFGLDGL